MIMFEVVSTNASNSNMYNIVVACIVMVALSSLNLVCYAQQNQQNHHNHNQQILNTIHLKSSPDSLSPQMATVTEFGNNNQPFCWSRPTGCTEEEMAQIGITDCSELRLNTELNRVICVPYLQLDSSSITTTNKTPPPPLPPSASVSSAVSQKEEFAPDVVTSVTDLEETIDSLIKSMELKELEARRLKNKQQQQFPVITDYNQELLKFGGHLVDIGGGHLTTTRTTNDQSLLNELIDGNQLIAYDYDNNNGQNSNNNIRRCKDSGDFYSDCKDSGISSYIDDIKRTIEQLPSAGGKSNERQTFSFLAGSGDSKGGFNQLRHKLATRAWRAHGSNKQQQQQDYRYATSRQQQQQELGGGLSSSPHHQQLAMTADEAKRLFEAQQHKFSSLVTRDPLTTEATSTSSSSSKVPIILLKFGPIRNQRRSSASELAAASSSSNLRASGRALGGPIRMLSYPTRLQRSDLNNSTGADHIKLLHKVDMDGSPIANGTIETGSGQQPQQLANVVVDENNRQVASSASANNNINNNNKENMSNNKDNPLECTMRRYTFRAVKSDSSGNRCSGLVTATICYGGCETGEIADWLFPHKKPIHKVCTHGTRIRRKVMLDECTSSSSVSANAMDNQLREYHYVDAKSCVCQKCTSQDTNCLGSLTRPNLSFDGPMGDGAAGAASKQETSTRGFID